MRRFLLCALTIAAPLAAQQPCPSNQWNDTRHDGHCEIREYTLANTGRLQVDSSINGGIRITGEDRANVLVRARVQARAQSTGEAKALAGQVQVAATPGNVHANGPTSLRDQSWSVSYEILAPRQTALQLKANNGGIGITGIEAEISFETQNGGVHLKDVGGNVHGKTVNGGLHVALAGPAWRGSQLDVQTTNGGIHVQVPDGFSARLEASTVNGGVHSNLAGVTLPKDRKDRNISVTLGSGGPLVRLVTTNGGIHLNKS